MTVTITPYVDVTAIMASVSKLTLIGTVIPYPSAVVPESWHACDGSALSKTEYPELYSVLGSTFGAETATEFYLPDLRGRTVIGTSGSHALASTGGVETQTLTVAQLPSHTHTVSASAASNGAHTHNVHESANNGSVSVNYAINGNSIGTYTSANSTPGCIVSAGAHTHDITGTAEATGSGASIPNMQPYSTLNYIIKVK